MDRNKPINNKTSLGLLIKLFQPGSYKISLSKTKTALTSGFEFSNGENLCVYNYAKRRSYNMLLYVL